MTTVRLIARLVWLPIAFLLSVAVAALVVVVIGQERMVVWLRARGDSAESDDVLGAMDVLVRAIESVASIATAATILPALALVIVGEVARIRSGLYYVIGGGAALAAIPFVARFGQSAGSSAAGPPPEVWQTFATAGFTAGLVYWLLAGRRA